MWCVILMGLSSVNYCVPCNLFGGFVCVGVVCFGLLCLLLIFLGERVCFLCWDSVLQWALWLV